MMRLVKLIFPTTLVSLVSFTRNGAVNVTSTPVLMKSKNPREPLQGQGLECHQNVTTTNLQQRPSKSCIQIANASHIFNPRPNTISCKSSYTYRPPIRRINNKSLRILDRSEQHASSTGRHAPKSVNTRISASALMVHVAPRTTPRTTYCCATPRRHSELESVDMHRSQSTRRAHCRR